MIARSLLVLAVFAFGGAAEDAHYSYMCKDILKPFFAAESSPGHPTVYRADRRQAWPSEFVVPRPPDTMRVFVVGESVARIFHLPGELDPLVGLLRPFWPGRRVEHINCGMAAYESGRILKVVQEVLGYGPSAVVILSGNNNKDDPCPQALDGRIGSILRRVKTEPNIARHESHLRRMVRLAKKKGVPIVLCTLPANMRDHAPWGSAPLSDPEFADAWSRMEKGDASGAARKFRSILRAEPENALASFYLARVLEKTGGFSEAKTYYERALEADDSRDRCAPSRDAMIRRVAREEGAALADIRALFEEAAPRGLVGGSMMADGVHWRDSYNPLAVCAIAKALGAACGSAPGLRLSRKDIDDQARRTLLYAVRHIEQWSGAAPDGEVLELAITYLQSVYEMSPAFLLRVSASKRGFSKTLESNFWVQGLDTGIDRYWPSYLCHLGEMLRRKGEAAKALGFLDSAASAAPDRYMARFYRGRAYAAAGRGSEAREDFESLRPHAEKRPEIVRFASLLGIKVSYGGAAWRKTNAH
ncbi:MAG: tetratricopeptide repeat protein [Elusimicrobiota bacterium]